MIATRVRRGFTLWEMAIVLAVVAVSAIVVVPRLTDLGAVPPEQTGDVIVSVLRNARRVAIERSQTVTVRIDPVSGVFHVDTSGVNGTGRLAENVLELGAWQSLVTQAERLTYVFRPTGAAFGDSVLVRGNDMTVLVTIDPWSGQAVVYAR
jgi:prepilin-type N-terminal cleavage/methylation domain-containing protein